MMTKADIRETKRNLQELIEELKNVQERGTSFWGTNPHYANIEKQVKELRRHVINERDYTLAIEVAGYSRDYLHWAAAEYNKEGKYRSALRLTTLIDELLEIESWLKEEYYHIPKEETDNYFMRDGKLLNIYTMEEYSEHDDNLQTDCDKEKSTTEQIEDEFADKSAIDNEEKKIEDIPDKDTDFAELKKFSPKPTLSLNGVYNLLIEYKAIPKDTTYDYFLMAVQYANFKKLINHVEGKLHGKNNLKYTIWKINKHYFDDCRQEYKAAAAKSMGLNKPDKLSQGEPTKSFKIKIDVIL